MEISSYSELEKEIERLLQMKDAAIENERIIEEDTETDSAVKEDRIKTSRDNIDAINGQLRRLEEYKTAYNTYIENIKEIQKILRSGEKSDVVDANLEVLRTAIKNARLKMPDALQTAAMHDAEKYVSSLSADVAGFDVPEEIVDFNKEYANLSDELDQVLNGVPLEEVGIFEFSLIDKNYLEISNKKKVLFEKLKKIKGKINEEEYEKLEELDKKLGDKLDKLKQDFDIIYPMKEAIYDKIKQEVSQNKILIAALDEEIKDCDLKINNPQKYGLSPENVEQLKSSLKRFQNQRNEAIKRANVLNENYKKVVDGGTLEQDFINSLNIEQERTIEPPQPIPSAPEEPIREEQTPPAPAVEKKPRKKGAAKPPRVVKENSLDDLIKQGIIPKLLPREELLFICRELGIKIVNKNTVLTPEQITRLQEDHEIQIALLNQQFYERNKQKISEFDKLIAKYKTIIQDINEHAPAFQVSFLKKVEKLLRKLEEKKAKYVIANGQFDREGYKVSLGTFTHEREENLDERAINKNYKLRKNYRKLDRIRSKTYKSKFRKKLQDKRIEKVLSRIEKLRGKKASIESKQTQIINVNTERYIERMTSKLSKYLERQNKVEKRVDKIKTINDRLNTTVEERKKLREDMEDEEKFLDRLAMSIESGRLGREKRNLERQSDIENFLGRFR